MLPMHAYCVNATPHARLVFFGFSFLILPLLFG